MKTRRIYRLYLFICIGHGVHMFYDLSPELVEGFFGILLVEDAVLFVAKADAGEEVGAIHAIH